MAETFPGLLRDRAAREPDRVAMRVGGEALTFGAWHDRAARIAAGLDVRRGERVGLLFGEHDWLDFAAAYVGVQAAGAVAMPISARTPNPEITRLLADFGAAGLIHGTGLTPEKGWPLPDVVADRPGGVDVRPGDLAQILFTSGTTGRPKGVSATHANLTYGYHPRMRRRSLAHSKLFLHAFPLGTNAAQTMLFNALTAEPAALVLPRFDAEEFCKLVETERAGTAFLVPAMAIDLVASGAPDSYDLSSVLLLGSTAAALPPEIAKTLAGMFPNADIVNYYSSTEAAPAQTVMIFDPDRPAAVGQPADGDLRITDAAGHPLPTGETGEVWLRSPTTARTYFGDANATSAVFRDGWVRMGDLGRLDDEGYLYLVDRESDVIKSGAFKISTLRIEAELYAHPDVRAAAVLGLPHPVLGSVPAAAVVLRRPLPVEDLRASASTRLARHEIPARWLIVDALPRNDAGKVLKRSLRSLFDAPSEPAAPASDAEARLARLWARALGRDVPAGADFFAAGGDSFAAARFAALAAEEFGVEVPVSFVFDFPDLAAQADRLADQRPTAAVQVDVADGVPLSSLQEYFLRWLGETAEPRAVSAVAVAIRITDLLDVPALRRALDDVVARHDALRTVFPGEAVVLDRCEPDFGVILADDPVRQACTELERPFDLAHGPLVRALVIEEGPEEFVLVLGVHHLVFDGHSMGVLLRELGECYAGQGHRLPPAGRAADVSAWARTRWPDAREFWRRALDGAPAALPGAPRSAEVAAFEGHSVAFEVPQSLTERLRKAVTGQRSTVYMGLLSVWAKAMAEWADSDEVVVMSPLPGRTKPEFDTVVGCLVQSLLLRIDVSDDPPFEKLLPRVRQVVLDATEHQYYPYEEFSRRIPQPAWLRFERWGGPVHFPGLESGPVELPRELMFSWPMPGPDLSVPELALTEHPDGRITGWLVHNRLTYEPPAIDRLAELVLAQLREVR
jgi:acyl-CoA synthetase (AMP-forming)/AMP-acid ligase II